MALIEVKELTYTYPGSPAPALKQVSFTVEAGQIVALAGANGAGKSTLCLALSGLIPGLYHGQMDGAVTLLGMDTSRHSPGQFAGKVGLVLPNPANQLSGMRNSVYAEVAFGLENLGIPRTEMPARIAAALQQTGLAALGERSPYTLSGGQQQRLALASILALQPPVLLLDEPTAMLDPQGSQELFAIVQRLARSGAAVIIAEHRLEWIARSAQRVIALQHGAVLLDGAPDEVLASPLLPQAGIGWLRYTQAAAMGRRRGLWQLSHPLPVSVEQAAAGFAQAQATGDLPNADPG
jgi:energy-coupling factor transporter ATP-binding protein EcfA2